MMDARQRAMEGGMWMRRLKSPPSPAVRSPVRRTDNKENIPPWRSSRSRNSTLPACYPRTPLRDITAVVNVLESRGIRMREAAAQRRNLDSHIESSPQVSLSTSPLPLDSSASGQASSSQCPESDVSETSAISAPPVEEPIQHSYVATHQPATVVKPVENGRSLCSSIEEIERAVLGSMKKKTKGQAKNIVQRQRTLNSMR